MINPASLLKLRSAKNSFVSRHPKFTAFLHDILRQGMEEGTVVEVTVTRPGKEPATANLKINHQDLELMNELKGMMRS